MNLIANAIQAIQDTGEIRISTRTGEGVVTVEIADTGGGIKPENLERIFDPGFTTTGGGVGTGLGLSISYKIIHKHRGDIRCHSEVGKGTVFTLELPTDLLKRQAEPDSPAGS